MLLRINKLTRALSEIDLSSPLNKKPFHHRQFDEEEEENRTASFGARSRTASFSSALCSLSELEEEHSGVNTRDAASTRVLVEEGGNGGFDKNDGGISRFDKNELTKWFLFCCSYVLASYAHFLWDADEEDVAEEESEKSFGFFNGVVPQHPPSLAAVC
ncbi:hypothetical protein P8452_47167 [Trifolium repens]|nr:hypothetical protein P8452_47167 [Trifolium repens]